VYKHNQLFAAVQNIWNDGGNNILYGWVWVCLYGRAARQNSMGDLPALRFSRL